MGEDANTSEQQIRPEQSGTCEMPFASLMQPALKFRHLDMPLGESLMKSKAGSVPIHPGPHTAKASAPQAKPATSRPE